MAIVTSFFDQQRAGEINAIINNNFANVSKYIPIHFDSLTTVERLNLGDDWKQDGKLVYDMDQELVYIWDADSVEWVQHLLEAKDSYARGLAQENQKKSFASVTLDENCQLIFKNSLGETVGTQLLTSDKIQYDSTDTIYTKIGKLMEQDAQMTQDIATINSKIGTTELPTSAQTLTGAISEIHTELDQNTSDITDIKSGDIVVGNAEHANNADEALDSDKLGGQAPSYYAKQSDLDTTNANVSANSENIATNQTNITELQEGLEEANNTIESNYQDFVTLQGNVSENTTDIETLEHNLQEMDNAVILKGTLNNVSDENYETELTQYIYNNYFGSTYTYKGKTALTEGNEQTELTAFVGGTPQEGWAVLDTTSHNTWVYEDGTWANNGIMVETGWAIRDSAKYALWIFEENTSSWASVGGNNEFTVTGVQLIDEDYTITLGNPSATYTGPTLTNFNQQTDTIRLFMNGAYMTKDNYSLDISESNQITVTNTGYTTYPWVKGWELTFLVTRVMATVE